jgi:hypothetical protein
LRKPLVLAFIAVALAAAGAGLSACGGAEQPAARDPITVTVTVTEPAPPPPPPAEEDDLQADVLTPTDESALTTFDGEYFAVDYPADWSVETAEVSKGTYLDTTIRNAQDRDVMLRIDVTPGSDAKPASVAAEVEAYLRRQPGYRRLRYEPTMFLGYDALRWDFVVEERGVLLRKSDIFFTTEAGDGVAALIQAPARSYRSRLDELEAARDSLVVAGEGSSTASDRVDAAEFCATHECIDNFEEGRGYTVQCADGTWSQSGGIQGACSHHGGLAGSGGAPSVGDVDDNGDGSTYNWCGAARDGDGDGRWCEGR